ncbi:MAG TPA: hypothetical protein VMX58_12340, partial [Patescibacteria group bacterium]|nr:hypothetical protein [Patescibacteria group bacterium]
EIYRSRMYGEIVALFCDSRGRVFACDTREEVLLSDDGGESWLITSMRLYVRNFAEGPGGDLFVASHNGVYRLGEDDSTWVGVLTGLPVSTLESMTIVPSGELLLATSQGKIQSFNPSDSTLVDVYSNRSGKKFQRIVSDENGNLYALEYGGILHRYLQARGTWVETDMEVPLYSITTGPQGIVLCGGTTTYLSEDGGGRWRAIGMQPVPVSAVAVDMAGRLYAGTSGSGIFRLNEGGAWALKFNSQYDGVLNVTTIYVREETTLYMGSAAEGVALSRDGGDTWWSRFDEGLHVYDFAVDPLGKIYTVFNGYICLIDEQLSRWKSIAHDVDYGSVYALEIDRAGDLIAGTSKGLFVSEDGVSGWRRVGADWIDEPVRTVCATDGGYCFCATRSAVWRSNRSYSRWWAIEGIPASDSTVSIVDIPDRCVVIGVYGEGLYVCSQEAAAAESITGGLPDLRITGCAADGIGELYVGTKSGVYVLDHIAMIVLRLAQ